MPRHSARLSERLSFCKKKGVDYTYDQVLHETDESSEGCRKKCRSKQIRSKNGRCYTPQKRRKTSRKNTKRKTTSRKNAKRKTTSRKNTKRKTTSRKNTKRKNSSPKKSPPNTRGVLKLATENKNALKKMEKTIKELIDRTPPKRKQAKRSKKGTKKKKNSRKTRTSSKGKKKGKCPTGQVPIPGMTGKCMLE